MRPDYSFNDNQIIVFLQISESQVQTENIWWNQAGSFEANHLIGERLFLRSQLSASRYYSGYRKDDFTYTRILATGQPRNFIFPFEYENRLLNIKWDQQGDFGTSDKSLWDRWVFGAILCTRIPRAISYKA